MRAPLSGLASKDLSVQDLVLPIVFAHVRHVVVVTATVEGPDAKKFFGREKHLRVDLAIQNRSLTLAASLRAGCFCIARYPLPFDLAEGLLVVSADSTPFVTVPFVGGT